MQSNLLFTKQLYRRTKNVKSSDMRIWSQAMMATFNSGFLSTKCQTFLCCSVHFHGYVFTINSFFQSSGYCWCVNSTSGRPIPGTSLHNARPNCEAQTGGKEPFQIYLSTNLNANLCIHINHSNFFGPQSVPVLQSRFGTSSVLFPLPKIILVQFQFRSRSKIFSKSYKY